MIINNNNYRPDIDGLRTLAVLAVVAFHTSPLYLPGGFVGVDIFFVISGFLITGIISKELDSNSFSLYEFYARRARRILPPLVAVLIGCLLIGSVMLLPHELSQLGKHVTAGVFFVQNLNLLSEINYFDVEARAKPLLHLWSLGVEEQYYLVWPLLLAAIWRYKSKSILIFVLFVISLSLGMVTAKTNPSFDFYSPLTRFWELLCGAMLAIRLRRSTSHLDVFPPNVLSILGILLMIASLFFIKEDIGFPGYIALAPVVGAVMFIAAGPSAIPNRLIFSNRFAVYLGLISYPLYLWHYPLLSFVYIMQTGSNDRMFRFSAAAISFVIAALSYHFIEVPVRRINAKRTFIPIITATLLVALAAVLVIFNNGLPWRYSPASIQAINEFQEEWGSFKEHWRADECFLMNEKQDFSEKCIAKGKPSIVLWGDSYAANYYHGLRSIFSNPDTSLSQLTAYGCPPFLEFDMPARPSCPKNNEKIREKILTLSPNVVIISAGYVFWDIDQDTRSRFHRSFETTIDFLKNSARQVIVLGPVPMAQKYQLKYAINNFESGSQSELYANENIKNLRDIDDYLSSVSRKKGVVYISPLKEFCNQSECALFIRNEDGQRKLISFDQGHLTSGASIYMARKFIKPEMHSVRNILHSIE